MTSLRSMIVVLASLGPGLTEAEEVPRPPVEQGMTVHGDQESPRILYIVPWKAPPPPRLPATEPKDIDLQPLDEGEFRRRLQVLEAITRPPRR
ncbi:MAG: hypothetical protein GWO16_11410 [Gammaproteobacteria bacterium]|nr:hypothetical protein [Gammaproteobacteria bacterium]NIR31086.1 hypothetical protein [Gammaproteobacteria bacterium]NIR98541.1 hypothetical protein [Gammaproteobacteria bacterium]NIT64263.1 hypothetical protein [Gammaproteobacteria bacterium]NIV21868.1 hypothetical protein [Gammaproteobacteria bacterium]